MFNTNPSTVVPVLVVYTRKGNEMSTTPLMPTGLSPESVDFSEVGTYVWTSDDWRLVQAANYELLEVQLPSWLSASEYAGSYIAWSYLWARGCDPTWSEQVQRSLLGLDCYDQTAAIGLLKVKNFRSEFRASLRAQVDAWIATEPSERSYKSPLSPRQLGYALTERDRRKAHDLDCRGLCYGCRPNEARHDVKAA
jgi:hypothetical protein